MEQGISDRTATLVNDLTGKALWYAWGRQDAGDGREVDAFAFAQHYGALAAAYATAVTSYRPSIHAAWLDYVAGAR